MNMFLLVKYEHSAQPLSVLYRYLIDVILEISERPAQIVVPRNRLCCFRPMSCLHVCITIHAFPSDNEVHRKQRKRTKKIVVQLQEQVRNAFFTEQ